MDLEETRHGGRPITTTEIARLCGVSRATVAAVLNGSTRIRESTRRKVLECIRREHYEPTMVAKSLLSEMSRMVVVLCAGVDNALQMVVLRGIQEVLASRDYHILFRGFRGNEQDDPVALETLLSYRPGGYIVLKGAEGRGGEVVRRIAGSGIPVVSQFALTDAVTSAVRIDDRAAGRLAADHVVSMGHRRLGYLSGPPWWDQAKERHLGFVESLIDHDIPMAAAAIVTAGDTPAGGYAAAMDLLRHGQHTAIVCFNEMVAMGAYGAAHELGLQIPRDLSVVGIDGIGFAELLGPPLTVVDLAPHEMGRRVALLLVEIIEGRGTRGPHSEAIAPQLVQRESVRALPERAESSRAPEVQPT